MHYVSLIVEFLRGRPAVVFWTAALAQAALWFVLPSLFYSAPPGDLPDVLAIGREFRLGSHLGPPLAFWLAEIAFAAGGVFGVYLLAQACIVTGFWAVFSLGRRIIGTRHAALAILLMVGVSAFSVSSPNFGPAVLAVPLWGLALLHYWRAVGEGERGYWFLLAIELGLLLLTSYAALILIVLLAVFSAANAQARAAFRYAESWISILFILFVATPHLAWLWHAMPPAIVLFGDAVSPLTASVRLLGFVIAAHLGLLVLVVLVSGWPRGSRRVTPPAIDRRPTEVFGRIFIYFFALMPLAVAVALVAASGRNVPLEQAAPLMLLSGLGIVTLAGDHIALHRERIASFAWLGLLVLPPVLGAVAIIVLPWTLAIDPKVAQPANDMGAFFADSFQRRTGKPLPFVSGDTRLASLVAIGAPSRPSLYRSDAPELSPWTNADRVREQGGILVWPVTDTAGAPPAALRTRFPELVPEVPRVFERSVQGRLPLIRVGWAVLRPAAAPPATPRQ